MIRTLLGAGCALALAGCVTAPVQTGGIPDVADGDISQATMVSAVRTLSADAFEGRMPGTAGEQKTVAFLIEQFRAAGLVPGNNGSWTQDVPLVEITGRDFAPLTIAGQGKQMSFASLKDWVGVTYREDAQTTLDDSELVFVGYGINAPEKGWNDYAGVDVKGKTVVILVNDPDYAMETLDGPFNGRAMTYYGRWTYKYEEAARQGAAGALIVHDEFPAAYGWNVVETSWSGPQAYAQRGPNAPPLTKVNGWIQKDVATQILAASGQNFDTLSAKAAKKGFTAVPLGLTASTSFASDIRSYDSQNVIGVLPGTVAPDEYVLHTAHWDHLGRCTPASDGDDICNGAVDNATGTAALIAMAQAHAKAGPARRSLMFLAVTAEEQGLLGADYYAANPVVPLAQTVGGVNMDALYPTVVAKDVKVMGLGKSELDEYLGKAVATMGRTIKSDPTPERGYYYRSDHFAFAKRGVPMIYAESGEDFIVGGTAAGKAFADDYTANRYHSAKDEFSEDWEWSGIMADLQLFYHLGRSIAMSDAWPNWVAGDEFKATRDASCAASSSGC